MNRLRQAAARERRAPIYWWLMLMVATGGMLVVMVHGYSRPGAVLVGVLLAAAWVAPLVAFLSLSMPARATKPPPAPGEGTYDEWMKQARRIGRVLLYYQDNPEIPGELRLAIRAAREDLRDTFKAHPLRDDLERVCERIRAGALKETKDWFGREYRPDIRELANEYEQAATAGMDENKRLVALQGAVSNAAALMSRNCMPRMLERERLTCAADCAWLAVQAAVVQAGQVSPVDLAEMLVIEWSDFSEPWQPARALRHALARLARAPAAAVASPDDGMEPVQGVTAANGKRYRRVRVRVKRRRQHRRRHQGPSLVDILRSFGQWVRYSARSWMLYR
ncbi:MAG: hypothetical protein EOM72_07720 [Opitutae bacterium]|nr:hypothetical protein [Opitutae bacterium]